MARQQQTEKRRDLHQTHMEAIAAAEFELQKRGYDVSVTSKESNRSTLAMSWRSSRKTEQTSFFLWLDRPENYVPPGITWGKERPNLDRRLEYSPGIILPQKTKRLRSSRENRSLSMYTVSERPLRQRRNAVRQGPSSPCLRVRALQDPPEPISSPESHKPSLRSSASNRQSRPHSAGQTASPSPDRLRPPPPDLHTSR